LLPGKVIYKYGAKTYLTKGVYGGFTHNSESILVYSIDNKPFSLPGDSGAPVFIQFNENEGIYLIGMIQGGENPSLVILNSDYSSVLPSYPN